MGMKCVGCQAVICLLFAGGKATGGNRARNFKGFLLCKKN